MENESAKSQTLKAILGLRGLIVDGELIPGTRVSEPLIIKYLGVSRTPARMALMQTFEEGLLERHGKSSYVVRAFSEEDMFQAIEVRGSLEGMAARLAAEGKATPAIIAEMQKCVVELDDVVSGVTQATDQDAYVKLNDQFHNLLLEASGSQIVERGLKHIKTLPFASPNAFVKSLSLNMPAVKRILIMAQEQHRMIVEAIRYGKGTRAQALALEHSLCATRYLQLLRSMESEIPFMSKNQKVK